MTIHKNEYYQVRYGREFTYLLIEVLKVNKDKLWFRYKLNKCTNRTTWMYRSSFEEWYKPISKIKAKLLW